MTSHDDRLAPRTNSRSRRRATCRSRVPEWRVAGCLLAGFGWATRRGCREPGDRGPSHEPTPVPLPSAPSFAARKRNPPRRRRRAPATSAHSSEERYPAYFALIRLKTRQEFGGLPAPPRDARRVRTVGHGWLQPLRAKANGGCGACFALGLRGCEGEPTAAR